MKISKRVTACEKCGCQEPIVAEVPMVEDVAVAEVTPVASVIPDFVACPYEKAIDRIYEAIDSLGELAKSDPIARESIANLSVVLFDLKG